jgi:hypothetical protein
VTRPVYAARAALIDLPHTATPDEIFAAITAALAPHVAAPADAPSPGDQALIAQVIARVNGARTRLGIPRDTIADVMRAVAGEHSIEAVVPDELPDDDLGWLAEVAAAAGFESHKPITARWVISKVIAAWRAIAQDLAASAGDAATMVRWTGEGGGAGA